MLPRPMRGLVHTPPGGCRTRLPYRSYTLPDPLLTAWKGQSPAHRASVLAHTLHAPWPHGPASQVIRPSHLYPVTLDTVADSPDTTSPPVHCHRVARRSIRPPQ